MKKSEIAKMINAGGTHIAISDEGKKIQIWRKYSHPLRLDTPDGQRETGEIYLGFFKKSEAMKFIQVLK